MSIKPIMAIAALFGVSIIFTTVIISLIGGILAVVINQVANAVAYSNQLPALFLGVVNALSSTLTALGSALTTAWSLITPFAAPIAIVATVFGAFKFYQYRRDNSPFNRDLLEACRDGDYAAAEEALKQGANPNCLGNKNGYRSTPLHMACDIDSSSPRASYVRIIQLLLSKGANAWVKDKAGRLPLHLAIQNNFYDAFYAFKGLQQAGNSIFNTPHDNIMPLMSLINKGTATNKACVATLLELGANPNLRSFTQSGRYKAGTPFGVFVMTSLSEDDITIAQLKNVKEICTLFLQKGANPLARVLDRDNGIEYTILQKLNNRIRCEQTRIRRAQEVNIVSELQELKSEIDQSPYCDGENFSPLHWAKKTSEKDLQHIFTKTTFFKNNHKIEDAYVQLANAFLANNNMAGLSYLVQHIAPFDSGYAHLQCIFAQQYLASIDDTLKTEEKTEYQKLFLEYCCKSLTSQEIDSAHRKAAYEQLDALLIKVRKDWAKKDSIALSDEKPSDNIYAWLAKELFIEAPKAVLAPSPAILPAFNNHVQAAASANSNSNIDRITTTPPTQVSTKVVFS